MTLSQAISRAIQSIAILGVCVIVGIWLWILTESFIASMAEIGAVFGPDGVAEIMEDME